MHGKYIISMYKLSTLYKHLVELHPEKLTEEEKNETKFYWVWDYYIARSNTEAICKQCEVTIRYKEAIDLENNT